MTTIRWRDKVILAKTEGTYGTDPVPTGNANAILMSDVSFSPMEGEDVARNLDTGMLGNQDTLPAALHAKLMGSTELAGSGAAGTAPAWGPLLRAASMAETIVAATSVSYQRASDSQESVTFYIYLGPTLYKSKGARASADIEISAQGIPKIKWTIQGLFVAPADAAAPTPDFTAWKAPLIANNTNTPLFTVDGVSLVLRNFKLGFGNDLQNKFLIGRDGVDIPDFKETLDARVEAVPLATFNPYAKAALGVAGAVAVAITHGTVAGNICAIAAPKCQVKRPGGAENENGTAEWSLSFIPLPTSGDDQFSITLT